MSTHTLLLISIGPVQDLIASARRCRDLWFGSWLLADAASAAACAIADEVATIVTTSDSFESLVFPGASARAELERDRGVANRILARIPGDETAATKLAHVAADAARGRVCDHARRAFDRAASSPLGHYFLRERAKAQIEDLLDIQWVVVREVEGYDAARRAADRWLAARKQTRIWTQPTDWAAPVPKSSVDGLRESVLREELYDDLRQRKVAACDAYRSFGVHPTERVCGVALTKRLGRDERFFSTSHLAAIPWLVGAARHPDASRAFVSFAETVRRVLGSGARDVLEVTPRALEPFGHLDGQVLFPSRLAELVEEVGDSGPSAVATQAIEKALRDLRKRLEVPREPIPYFAVLLADGDRMGKAIDEIQTHVGHRDLSRALSCFADHARELVERHLGSLVYSGGDDVLALLPLHTAVACARALHDAFGRELASVCSTEHAPTLSVGLAVGHHLTPLSDTLDLARRAERLAKLERDSLAVIVDKRGGAEVTVRGRWSESTPLDVRLARFVGALRAEAIPDKAAFELEALDRLANPTVSHPGVSAPTDETMQRMLKHEVARVLSRRRKDRGASPMAAEEFEALASADPGKVARELKVARLLAEADLLANPPAPRAESTPVSPEVPS